MTLELNENEAQVLLQLLDMATKAGGLNVAEAALHISKKVMAEMPQPEVPQPDKE